MTTLADEILSTPDPEPVKVSAWGKTLFIKPMSGTDRDDYEMDICSTDNRQNFRAKMLVRCLFDAEGKRIFSDDQADALGKKHCKETVKLFAKAQKVNALTAEDVEELKKT